MILAYVTVLPIIIAFAAYAFIIALVYHKKHNVDTERFITARSSIGRWRIAFSFYAGSVGSWVVTGPANYATFAGLLGCCMYAISAGLPIFLIAFLGNRIVNNFPNTLSLPHFIGWRFGPIAKAIVVCISMFSMALGLLAEYTTLGALFKDYVGTTNIPIIVLVGILTTCYTAVGGLYVSIVTDRLQAIASLVLVVVLFLYLAIDFRADLPTPLTDDQIGLNYSGFSSIVAMPVSLIAVTVFNEAMWQRVWASESKSSLYFGAGFASVAAMLITFMFGFGGFLAQWAGYITAETNYNLYWFTLFTGGESIYLNNWQGLITLIAASIMSESAIDSFQNGMASVLVSTFLEGRDIKFARLVVIVLNVPIIVLACLEFANGVLSLFLLGNMITSCAVLPIISGLIRYEKIEKYITEFGVVFAIFFSLLSVSLYGIGNNWVDGNVGESIWKGLQYAWYDNQYSWDYFAIACGSSIVGGILGCTIRIGLAQNGWKMPELRRYDKETSESRAYMEQSIILDDLADLSTNKLSDPN